MGVGFITGRAGCDKIGKVLDLCFEEAEKDDVKPIYILVPEKFTYEMERQLSERFLTQSDPNFRIRVVSFSTLSKIVFTNVGGLKEKKITKSARSMLIYKAIESVSKEMEVFKSKNAGIGIVGKIMDVIIEFKQNDMSVQEILEMSDITEDEALKLKLKDLAKIYARYDNFLHQNYIDTEDNMEFFAKKLDDYEDIKGATIFVVDYTGFTPIQYLVIEKLILLSKNMYFSLITDLKNFNARRGVFSKTNTTFMKINEICYNNKIKRLKDIEMIESDYFESEDLRFLEKHINDFNPKQFDSKPDNIEIYEFKNTHMEVEHIAGEIVKLVRDKGYRYREITVATRNLDSYSYLVKAIFNDYKIGYFMDEKIAAKDNSIIMLVMSILDMKQKNYSYGAMFRYLKSGLSGIDSEEISILENYVLANGIKGIRWFDDRWNYSVRHGVDEEDIDGKYYDKINEIKNKVMYPIEMLHNKLKGRNTAREICRYLYEFAIDIELPERIDDLIERFEKEENLYRAKEYSQVWNIFTDMLDEMVEFIGDEKIGLEKFIKLMEAEFEAFELGIIPPARDQVFVTSIDRMKNPETKVLFMIGVNDGVFPKNISDESVLTDVEKRSLLEKGIKFDSDEITKIYDEEFLVYKSMSSSKSKLVVTYPIADFEGKSMRQSRLIKKIKRIFPNIEIKEILEKEEIDDIDLIGDFITSKEQLFEDLLTNINKGKREDNQAKPQYIWNAIYTYFKNDEEYKNKVKIIDNAIKYDNNAGVLDRDLAIQLYGSGMSSVSKLEKYAGCPFSYFMMYGLKAKEREVYEFSTLDYGVYAHKVLDDFSKGVVKNRLEWNEVNRDYIQEEIKNISQNIVDKNDSYILNTSDKYEYMTKRINETLIDSVEIMVDQIKAGEFLPKGFEIEFGKKSKIDPIRINVDKDIHIDLVGKIDRMDSYLDDESKEEYIRVIDYKSSRHSIDMANIVSGLQMQLFVYMNAVLNSRENKSEKTPILSPAAVLYSTLNSKMYELKNSGDVERLDEEDLKIKIMGENKLSGFVLKDIDIIGKMDRSVVDTPGYSYVIPARITKSGIGDTHTNGLSKEEFNTVSEFVLIKAKEICKKIYGGIVDIKPYKYADRTACDYCSYKSICQFDSTLGMNSYNLIKKIDKKKYPDILKEMKQKIDSNKEEK
ncbi:helicase-exonuclease AddAB subunit AddB [Peptostreptococcus faecalis]|uniref:helicase-exonuclease AddAB subunit AddB n=1 Tax=Peptostreptococcus faecalis TaxID=2045015 RepID=UPI000C7E2491|nr:helicase-exonuclease AddAB subunit AddB [Peptostreptococcus faecalis]